MEDVQREEVVYHPEPSVVSGGAPPRRILGEPSLTAVRSWLDRSDLNRREHHGWIVPHSGHGSIFRFFASKNGSGEVFPVRIDG